MGGVEVIVVAGVVILALAIFCILQIRSLAKRSGEAKAKEAQVDEIMEAQKRRQKMATRERATGQRLLDRLSKWRSRPRS
mgnify:CR=1 FL=1